MWSPAYQAEDDRALLWESISRWSFATLVSADDAGRPHATQIPFIVRGARLFGHLAAANPHAELVRAGRPVLCHFAGPHAYVSPAWYEDAGQVPTWNYAQVQVSGRPRVLDADGMLWTVQETVGEHENERSAPLDFATMAGTAQRILGGIVAFEVEIERMHGRFKLSQNKSDVDRVRVAEELRRGDALARSVAELMDHHRVRGALSER